jgi:two-component system OmpR family response regulator
MKAKMKILLLEDDTNLGFILTEHLQMNGFDVVHCSNGADGLAAFRRTKFSLCLADVMMPKKDGFTFVKEIRQTDQQIPVIFLTAKSLKEDRIEGTEDRRR